MTDPTVRERDLDGRVRAALDPTSVQVERVAREALKARPGALDRTLRKVFEWQPSFARRHPLRSLTGFALLLTLGAWLGALAMLLVLSFRPEGPSPAEPTEARYSLNNRNGVLVVRRPDGGTTFLHSRELTDDGPRGMVLIVRGEDRP